MPSERVYSFSNARLSLVQSCLREVVCTGGGGEAGPGLRAGHPVLEAAARVLDGIDKGAIRDAASARAAYLAARAGQAPRPPGTVGPAEDCLDLLAQYALAWAFDDQAAMAEIRGEFTDSECDPGWLSAMAEWLGYYWDGRLPQYLPPAADTPAPIPLPPPASADGLLRVAVLGDWGTGEPDAIAVLDQLMQQKPDVIVHIGDIYYSGTPNECRKNFLDPIVAARAKYGRPVPVYNLAGNHDYYSGGAGYYGMLAELNGNPTSPTAQTHSFFCLRNDDWQLEGMDTGYNDHDLLKVAEDITSLRDDEAAWHASQIASAGSRKVILFSHHQLFSAFQTIGGGDRNAALAANLAAWRALNANIVAWLWGHEHLLEIYDGPGQGGSTLPILGRCIGHGAFPVFNNEGLYDPINDTVPLAKTPTPPFYVQTGDDGLVYNHGYAMLTLGPASGTAAYFQVVIPADGSSPTSQALWTETIPAPTGS